MNGIAQFGYLSGVANKYGSLYFENDFQAVIDGIKQDQLQELAAAYEAIESKRHAHAISKWIHHCFAEKLKVSRKEFRFSQEVGQLFVLFGHLATRGFPPFNSRTVEFVQQHKKPNWDNLPQELGYLAEVAEKYGGNYTESDILEFLDHAREDDMELLARTAERIRLNSQSKQIDEWLRRFPMDKHQEAWLVHCLLGVMDHAGLAFD
jgi:hypothetical protein